VWQTVAKGAYDVRGVPLKRVLWVTNLAAPYRRPVWRHLAGRYELTVGLLESNAGLQHDRNANRGHDWLHRSEREIIFTEIPTWKFSRGESRFYILKYFYSLRKFDIILFGGWESPAYWSLLIASMFYGIARVGFYESHAGTITHKSGLAARVRSKFFRSMNMVVVPGEAAAEAIIGLGITRHRIVQGFNAVDVTAFHRAATARNPEQFDASCHGHRYLYVGQLIARKRVDAIIHSFVQIAEPEDELTIVGTGDLGEELNNLIPDSGVKIRFVGHIENDQMPELMARHQTLVLASDREVWGLVVNEALASGMHVVVGDNCGVSASIRGMRGIYMADPTLVNLATQMDTSRSEWTGRIAQPEILQFTPERFAEVFDRAFVASLEAGGQNNATYAGKDDLRSWRRQDGS
jgi:glycosyltransferase involved in cell wall biosynthesis